jgi:hypothetical protein
MMRKKNKKIDIRNILSYIAIYFAITMTICLLYGCDPEDPEEDPDDHYAFVWSNQQINLNVSFFNA